MEGLMRTSRGIEYINYVSTAVSPENVRHVIAHVIARSGHVPTRPLTRALKPMLHLHRQSSISFFVAKLIYHTELLFKEATEVSLQIDLKLRFAPSELPYVTNLALLQGSFTSTSPTSRLHPTPSISFSSGLFSSQRKSSDQSTPPSINTVISFSPATERAPKEHKTPFLPISRKTRW